LVFGGYSFGIDGLEGSESLRFKGYRFKVKLYFSILSPQTPSRFVGFVDSLICWFADLLDLWICNLPTVRRSIWLRLCVCKSLICF